MSPLPTFANSRGIDVSGMPTSAIFEKKGLKKNHENLPTWFQIKSGFELRVYGISK